MHFLLPAWFGPYAYADYDSSINSKNSLIN